MGLKRESYVEYLRRVANDHDASGTVCTADDYRSCAGRLRDVEEAIDLLTGTVIDKRAAVKLLKRAVRR